MPVTSNALFHFTPSLKNLQGILKERFKASYCRESYSLNGFTLDKYYPMISFCDLPLSQAGKHIRSYGPYGIGMTKEWGIKHHLNPVNYIESNSYLAADLISVRTVAMNIIEQLSRKSNNGGSKVEDKHIDLAMKLLAPFEQTPEYEEIKNGLIELLSAIAKATIEFSNESELISIIIGLYNPLQNQLRYIKNYEGTLIRKDKQLKNYRFYDEREWRFIPELNDSRVQRSMNRSDYEKFRAGSKSKPFIPGITVPFIHSDIKYLIVASNKDVPKLLRSLTEIEGLVDKSADADLLATRIFTVQQLEEDF